ncbi:MAG: hypothetical protein ABI647_21815 [Gemmatimonadota bacterium]
MIARAPDHPRSPAGSRRWALGAALAAAGLAVPALAQKLPAPGDDSTTKVAGAEYRAGGIRRFFLGAGYRDLWTASLRAPVLNLETFAGGIKALKASGGKQTKSLRFETADGFEYVFRSVDKDNVAIQDKYRGTIVEKMARDGISSSYPAAPLATALMLDAAGVLHPTPSLVVMPDDPALGEFRKEFAGRLGTIEEYPTKPHHAEAFARAVDIIDSEKLLPLLNAGPTNRVATRVFLRARLMDMLFNDWDRHPGNWKWAQLESGADTVWDPIARDRDKAFASYQGLIPGLLRLGKPELSPFRDTYLPIRALTVNSVEFDRRLLAGLEWPVWDSVVAEIKAAVTDSVIEASMRRVPQPYQHSAPGLVHRLEIRRDHLQDVAKKFYQWLAELVDIHATDAADRARVTRLDGGRVEVRLESENGAPYFQRRFDRNDTHEIRLYLHGGDDVATITGDVHESIPILVIGGNGTNRLADSSLVNGRRATARLYDNGKVEGVTYGQDTLYNREPWVLEHGKLVSPGRTRGSQMKPAAGAALGDLGFVARLGFGSYRYGFAHRPYASSLSLGGEWSSETGGFRLGVATDHRLESSSVHFGALVRMSELEVTSFHGLGNRTLDSPAGYFDVHQRQWLLQPTVGVELARRTELSFGPVLQYSVTDDAPGRFITANRPYGSGRFGEAGLRLDLRHQIRDRPTNRQSGLAFDLSGSFFPAVWDVASAFGSVTAGGSAFVRIPVPARPILALRAGGAKVFGEVPFHEAAFIGGAGNVRTLPLDRYAGDASLYGGAELRVPLAAVRFVLPFDIGIFGLADAGRVFVRGESPGGWRTAIGAGFWIGILDPSTGIRVELADGDGRTRVLIRTGLAF